MTIDTKSGASVISHPAYAILEQILATRKSAAFFSESLVGSEETTKARDHIFAVMELLRSLFIQTPLILVSTYGLTSIQANLQNILSELTNYTNNGNIAHITNAFESVDASLLPALWAFPAAKHRDSDSNISKIFEQLQEASGLAISSINNQKNILAVSLENTQKLVSDQDQKITLLTEAVEKQKNDALSIVSEVRIAYATTEKSLLDQISELKANWIAARAIFDEDSAKDAKLVLDSLGSLESDARRIVQVVGNIGATGNYKIIADNEGAAARFWRWITVGIFALGVTVAMVSFSLHIYNDLVQTPSVDSVWTFAMRLATAIVIALPALYTARESARHRTNSDRARQKELELASLGPFIELLPDISKVAIREKLTERYFGAPVDAHEIKSILDNDVVVRLVEAVSNLTLKLKLQ